MNGVIGVHVTAVEFGEAMMIVKLVVAPAAKAGIEASVSKLASSAFFMSCFLSISAFVLRL